MKKKNARRDKKAKTVRNLLNIGKVKMSATFLAAAFAFVGCFQDPMSASNPRRPGADEDVQLQLHMAVSGVDKLGKSSAISLSKMVVVLTSNATPRDTVRDTIVAGTNGMVTSPVNDQNISKNYALKSLRTWKVVATVLDTRGYTIHADSATTPTLYSADTAAVSLNLTSRYAMYEAKFLNIPDSINSASGTFKQKLNLKRLVLKVDGVAVVDSTIPSGYFAAGSTPVLAYDYVLTGTKASLNSGTTVNLNATHFGSASRGFAVGNLGTIARTTDGGLNWASQNMATGKTLRAVYFLNATTGWAVGDSVVYRTVDGGDTWQIHGAGAPNFLNTTQLRGVYFKDANNGILVAASGSTYLSTNGGANWSAATTVSSTNYALDAFNDTIWVAASGGNVRRNPTMMNVTAAWTTLNTGVSSALRGISAPSNSVVIAVGDGGVIRRTTNGGANWTAGTISPASSQNLLSVHMLDVGTGFAVGENGTILSTLDSGATWKVETTPAAAHLNSVAFFGGTGYIAGNTGSGGNSTLLTLSGPRLVEMIAYGPMGNWNTANPLFYGSKYVHAIAGESPTVSLNLAWVGPTTGTGSITATLGRVGKVTIIGTLPGTTMP